MFVEKCFPYLHIILKLTMQKGTERISEILKRRNIKLEAYTRRENLKIFGIKESVGETNEKTEELVRSIVC